MQVILTSPATLRTLSGDVANEGDYRIIDGERFHASQVAYRDSAGNSIVHAPIVITLSAQSADFDAKADAWRIVQEDGTKSTVWANRGITVTVIEDAGEPEGVDDAPDEVPDDETPPRGRKSRRAAEEEPAPRGRGKAKSRRPADDDDMDDSDDGSDDGSDADDGNDDGNDDYEEPAPRGRKQSRREEPAPRGRKQSRRPADEDDMDDGDADDGNDDGNDDYEEPAPRGRSGKASSSVSRGRPVDDEPAPRGRSGKQSKAEFNWDDE